MTSALRNRTTALLFWLVVGIAAAAAQTLPAGVSPTDRTAIESVIRHQLDAFRRDDAPAAYAFAAPDVQRIFPDPGLFLDMVRRGYPPVYRPRSAEFSELALRDGDLIQEVELVGPDGHPALALYTMRRSPEGAWLIAACTLVPSVRLGV